MKSRWSCWYSSEYAAQAARFRCASGELIAEPERDLALRRSRRVGTVHEVVRHRQREVAANRPGSGVRRVGRPHRRPDDHDRALALEHERERRSGGDELNELPEERFLAMLGVVAVSEVAVDREETRGADVETAGLEATQDLAREKDRKSVV